jgi:hypothetical protein
LQVLDGHGAGENVLGRAQLPDQGDRFPIDLGACGLLGDDDKRLVVVTGVRRCIVPPRSTAYQWPCECLTSKYFFKLNSFSWLVVPVGRCQAGYASRHRDRREGPRTDRAGLHQGNAHSTTDADEVLAIAYEVYRYIFRAEHLGGLGMPEITEDYLRMLRQVGTFMALNKVELTGDIANIGPAWFFNSTTRAVFDLSDAGGDMLDEVYHGRWFNETRRLELVRATPRWAAGWSTAAGPCRARPGARSSPTAPRWNGSGPNWRR